MKISARLIGAWFGKNKPALMLATGIAGVTTTIVFSVRGHMKAKKIVDRAGNCRFVQPFRGHGNLRRTILTLFSANLAGRAPWHEVRLF